MGNVMSFEQLQLVETLRGVEGYDAIMHEAGNMVRDLVMDELTQLKGGMESVTPQLCVNEIGEASYDGHKYSREVEPVRVPALVLEYADGGYRLPTVLLTAEGIVRLGFVRLSETRDPGIFRNPIRGWKDVPRWQDHTFLNESADWIKYGRKALEAIQWHNNRASG